MNSTATVNAPAKIEFSKPRGDRYESTVEVTADGHYVGELYRDGDDDWTPGRMLSYEMESIAHRTWSRLTDAEHDLRAAAAVAINRVARLRFQRRELAAASDAPPTPATPTCAVDVAAPIEWRGAHAFIAGALVAVIATPYGGRKIGTYDAAADRMHWSILDGVDADEMLTAMRDRGDLHAIPDAADLNP